MHLSGPGRPVPEKEAWTNLYLTMRKPGLRVRGKRQQGSLRRGVRELQEILAMPRTQPWGMPLIGRGALVSDYFARAGIEASASRVQLDSLTSFLAERVLTLDLKSWESYRVEPDSRIRLKEISTGAADYCTDKAVSQRGEYPAAADFRDGTEPAGKRHRHSQILSARQPQGARQPLPGAS
jgi:hypothetical protein